MSWRNLLAAAAGLTLLSVSACGFKPVYDTSPTADAGGAMERLNHVTVAVIPDRVGVRLRSELQRLFSPAAEPPTHTLHIALQTRTQVMAIEDDASVRRSVLHLVAEVRLVPSGGAVSMPEFKTTVRSNAGAEQLPSDFATLVSEGAAEQRAVEELAQRIRQQLAVHFARTG